MEFWCIIAISNGILADFYCDFEWNFGVFFARFRMEFSALFQGHPNLGGGWNSWTSEFENDSQKIV